MAAIVVTANAVGVANREHALIRPYIAAVSITAGQSVYQNTSGKAALCSANTSGSEQFLGIALNAAAAGQAVDVMEEGEVTGFTLTSQAYDALIYQADAAGGLADAASGTKTVGVGRVMALSDSTQTKVLYVQRKWTALW